MGLKRRASQCIWPTPLRSRNTRVSNTAATKPMPATLPICCDWGFCQQEPSWRRNTAPYAIWRESACNWYAVYAMRFNAEAKRFYERKKTKTDNVVAIKALAHKLARACFHMLKEGKPFDAARCFA